MSKSWYYVEKGERRGPFEQSVLEESLAKGILTVNDYVWTKGFDNWKKIEEVEEFVALLKKEEVPEVSLEVDLKKINTEDKIFTVKIGLDRGGKPVEYGPYALSFLKKLYRESRINGKTLIFSPGMKEWKFLADLPNYQELFEEVPPIIEEMERRKNIRKPFVARMFFHNKKKLYEGTCRDISIGGMQVLVSGAPVKIGEEIAINVHPENTEYSFVANGTVVRVLDGGQGFSFRFSELPEEAKSAIANYLSKE